MNKAAKDSVVVHPATTSGGVLSVPGDKSISHRTAMFAALVSGSSRIEGFLRSSDCLATLQAMESLGAHVETAESDGIHVEGVAGTLRQPGDALNMGNSGTGMRLLTGLLCGFDLEARLEGDESLSSRPMGRIQRPLEMMGAQVELLGDEGRPPILVRGGGLQAIEYDLPVASAQVKSAILLAGAMAHGRTVVSEPRPTRDHTERIMQALGLPVEIDGKRVSIVGSGGKALEIGARDWQVPGDFSSAAFWMVAAAATPGVELLLSGVGINPRRTAFMDVLRRMGAEIEVVKGTVSSSGEPYGDIVIRGGELSGVTVGGDEIPNLIDECPLVAVAGALAGGDTIIRDASELRVKESDRIAVMCENLQLAGVDVEEREDGMRVSGSKKSLKGGIVARSYGDHRIAMAMAVLALFGDSPLRIEGVECVQTSYPGFWNDMKAVGGRVETG